MRIERQIDAGRSQCRAAIAARSGNIPLRPKGPCLTATDSSTFEDTDSEIDLGGPEGSAPIPDNDETMEEVRMKDERRHQNGKSGEDLEDEQDAFLRSRRAGSAPATPANASSRRRRQIISSLGLSSDQPSPLPAPLVRGRHTFDFLQSGDELVSGSEGLSTTIKTPTEKKLRRRLSTGQLWLGRRNKGSANSTTAFGSGLSEDEDSNPDLESERSYDKH